MELAQTFLRPLYRGSSGVWTGRCYINQWINLDSLNTKHLFIRINVLRKHNKTVISIMPTAEVACRELFHYVFTYLYTKYPEQYFLNISYNSYRITCYSTKRTYFVNNLATHNVRDLFTILSECVAMDFSILKKN